MSHHALEGGSVESSGQLPEIYTDITAELSDAGIAFFKKWLRLVQLENGGKQF